MDCGAPDECKALPPLTGVLLAMDGGDPDEGAEDEGNIIACLQRCDVRTLRQLKAVSAGWQQRARRVLWERLCFCQGSRPQSLDDVEELDVEELQHVGLHCDVTSAFAATCEAVAAVRSMPNLARLRGYGFRVELNGPQGVRQAELSGMDRSGPLGGAALRGCIHEGEAPEKALVIEDDAKWYATADRLVIGGSGMPCWPLGCGAVRTGAWRGSRPRSIETLRT